MSMLQHRTAGSRGWGVRERAARQRACKLSCGSPCSCRGAVWHCFHPHMRAIATAGRPPEPCRLLICRCRLRRRIDGGRRCRSQGAAPPCLCCCRVSGYASRRPGDALAPRRARAAATRCNPSAPAALQRWSCARQHVARATEAMRGAIALRFARQLHLRQGEVGMGRLARAACRALLHHGRSPRCR